MDMILSEKPGVFSERMEKQGSLEASNDQKLAHTH
jgi:hypothetical protein